MVYSLATWTLVWVSSDGIGRKIISVFQISLSIIDSHISWHM